MSSDCSSICGLPDPPWEAAGRNLPPASQARAVRKILSRCQWRDWSNRFRCQLRPGATSRILPGPIIAAGFAPASVGVHRIEVAYYISSGNAGECAFAQICLKLGACWDKQVANITYGVVLLRIVLNSCLSPASAASNTAELGMRKTSRRLATS